MAQSKESGSLQVIVMDAIGNSYSGSNRLRKNCLPRSISPQRLEAAVDLAGLAARVELVPFPFLPKFGVFPQPPTGLLKNCFSGSAVPSAAKEIAERIG